MHSFIKQEVPYVWLSEVYGIEQNPAFLISNYYKVINTHNIFCLYSEPLLRLVKF
jgi:hypothetical protein